MTTRTQIADEARQRVEDLGRYAKDRAAAELRGKAQDMRDAAAQEAQTAADAAEAAAAQFEQGSLQSQAACQIADRIEAVADHIRSTDPAALVKRTSDFARRNPLWFVGGAAALGFMATRFLTARDPRPELSTARDDPWSIGPARQSEQPGGPSS